MEIVEIISYYVNHSIDTIEVKFRLNEDNNDEIRVDEIELSESDDFGYNLIMEDLDFYDEDDEDDVENLDDGVDEDELLAFLNEYYMIYPERLPTKDLY
jgi:hypothetical protein